MTNRRRSIGHGRLHLCSVVTLWCHRSNCRQTGIPSINFCRRLASWLCRLGLLTINFCQCQTSWLWWLGIPTINFCRCQAIWQWRVIFPSISFCRYLAGWLLNVSGCRRLACCSHFNPYSVFWWDTSLHHVMRQIKMHIRDGWSSVQLLIHMSRDSTHRCRHCTTLTDGCHRRAGAANNHNIHSYTFRLQWMCGLEV